MRTPIADFVRNYQNACNVRLHMPGHKGIPLLGPEPLDITEVKGADALYEAEGIIRESEQNATFLFGTRRSVFSTEGSSQCIRAMLYLAAMAAGQNRKPLFLAGRNAHKTFLFGAALLDAEVLWLGCGNRSDLCSIRLEPAELDQRLTAMDRKPAGVYVTSPDYLGNEADLAGLAEVCHRHGTLLLVDNAHGAYLHFLPASRHPMDLGADLCCDSAHKTLPVLTGGAYLHLSATAPEGIEENMKQAMALFGSTSPSYLILASLDLCNRTLAEDFRPQLQETVRLLENLRSELRRKGWQVMDSDPLKLTVKAPEGCSGTELAERMRKAGFECEFADPDWLVMMLTPLNRPEQLEGLAEALGRDDLPYGDAEQWQLPAPEQVMSLRDAIFAPREEITVDQACGRIAAVPTVACPPAIPVVCSGERITPEAVKIMKYYGMTKIAVIRAGFEK